jgi:RND family efflux transporter MFP subunit
MAVEDAVIDQDAVGQRDAEPPQNAAKAPLCKTPVKRSGWRGFVLFALALAVVAGGGFLWLIHGQEERKKSASRNSGGDEHAQTSVVGIRVKVAKPQRGGMERTTNQPGTLRAFQYAPLYSKVSGFVQSMKVDRGSHVRVGDLLLEVYDPEKQVAVLQAQAALDHAKATESQAEAHVKVAEANVQAAAAKQADAQSKLEEMISQRDYRKKQYDRIYALAERQAIEQRLVDEQFDQWHAAEASVHSAEAGIKTAAAEYAEAKANVEKAQADVKVAKAQIEISAANLKMANVFVEYTKITSPYDGVVTYRGESVHPGSFIRSAAEGGSEPLLTVARTDKMRTIVLVPDRDVPYCKVGDPATITVDALAGRVFPGAVSRIAESEDLADRNMRVEIDLPNPDGALKDGLFGRALILLEKDVKNLTIPSKCLIERNGRGEGSVLVVKGGEVHRTKVQVGLDNGLLVEVISGVEENDQVILQPDASIADGTKVQVETATSSDVGASTNNS